MSTSRISFTLEQHGATAGGELLPPPLPRFDGVADSAWVGDAVTEIRDLTRLMQMAVRDA